MSLVFVEVCCNWPSCSQTLRVNWNFPLPSEAVWLVEHTWLEGRHLCPAHATHSWAELDEEISRLWVKQQALVT